MADDRTGLVDYMFTFAEDAPGVNGLHVAWSFVAEYNNDTPLARNELRDYSGMGEGIMLLRNGRLSMITRTFFSDRLLDQFYSGEAGSNVFARTVEQWQIDIDRAGEIEISYPYVNWDPVQLNDVSYTREGWGQFAIGHAAHGATYRKYTFSFDRVYNLGPAPRVGISRL